MIFHQFFDEQSSTYTYLIGSKKSKQAILIDPVLDNIEDYIQMVRHYALKLIAAMDTHLHADHITATGTLSQTEGCLTMMGRETKAERVQVSFQDNENLNFDDFTLKALYTPGHTDDSYCFLMDDRVFTGDTLLIGGTGRTDFQNGSAEQQYDSIFKRLLTLPEETLVYPAHDYKGNKVSSIGQEKQTNPRLQVNSKAEYVDMMNNLNLPMPKKIKIAVPANIQCGLTNGD